MIDYVRNKINIITQNANKRKTEEQKLEQEKAAIKEKQEKIMEL